MLRLTDPVVKDLDTVCATYSGRLGRVVHRSALIEHLVKLAMKEIRGGKKSARWVPPPKAQASV